MNEYLNYKITYYPSYKNIKDATHLYLSNNNLSHIPKFIYNLRNLECLSLANNNITNEDIPLNFNILLPKLTYLNIDNNQLTYIPDSICNMINLQTLYLSNNRISCINPNIKNLTKLKYIDLSHNNISTIPTSFSCLNLDLLFINDNNINVIKNINNNVYGIYIRNNPILKIIYLDQ